MQCWWIFDFETDYMCDKAVIKRWRFVNFECTVAAVENSDTLTTPNFWL
jgi:hypothetical protein